MSIVNYPQMEKFIVIRFWMDMAVAILTNAGTTANYYFTSLQISKVQTWAVYMMAYT